MKNVFKTALKEIARIAIAAFLAALGVNSTGCVASGNNSAAAFSVTGK